MTTLPFIHLRLHTEYSIVDGLVRIGEAVDAAVEDHQPALGISDLSNLFGMVKLYEEARAAGIKPVLGCDVWITNEADRDNPFRLLLYVKNKIGYHQLCDLLSQAWLENVYNDHAEVRVEWLEALAKGPQGNQLIALSGAHFGDIGMAIEKGNIDLAKQRAQRWAAIFPGSFYIEIQRAGQKNQEVQVRQSVAIAAELKLPVVATHPIQFLKKEQFTAHEVRVCIAEGETLANPKRARKFNDQQYFKTQDEMRALFADIPGAIANTSEIAKRCNLTLVLGQPQLPNFPIPEGMTIDDYLIHQTREGFEMRLAHLYPDPAEREKQRPRYEERLKFELDIIIKMQFPGYFLIVADFIQWSKNNGVPVGPGRGSGAGSLVAYCLLITDLDPLAYNLLFERFLNPERVSMPDFDVDFDPSGRDRVIAYVKEHYGKEAVSQIATFGTMAAKGAIRDVGRVLNLGYNFCDGISKLIPFKPGKQVTIAEALEEEPQLKERMENEEEVKQLLDLAQQVEGITRNIGMHAGGVLIAPGKLTDFCPLYTQDGEAGVVSQYDKHDVESVGLVKFDFLGLTTLTILDYALKCIKELDPSKKDFELNQIPLDDQHAYEIFKTAKTVAVFQFESRGMQGMLKEALPDRFEDIIALVSLYRPGPMDLIPDFVRRKHGEAFEYPDPRTEGILSDTYGIMVYQEQVMQMAQVIGGYSLGGADLLRRAMGKKKVEEMVKHRSIFREGAAKNGLSEQKADEIFDLMEKFAGYGFNKSHAAAYALLAYYTAWLKAYHPAEFFAANMSLALDDTEKVKTFVEDAKVSCGIEILPPDVNYSDYRFVPVGEPGKQAKQIRYGLGAIKGSGQAAIEAIVEARKEKPFVDLFDFTRRVNKHHLNRRTIDALIRAGAFDSFKVDRAILQASIDLAWDSAEQEEASAQQVSLFGGDNDDLVAPLEYVKARPWSDKQKLVEEKNALGFYFSGHLFSAYAKEVRQFIKTPLSKLQTSREPKLMTGVISAFRTQMTQRGKMAIVTIDDGTAAVDVTIFNELLEQSKDMLKEDELLVVNGKVSEDRFSGGLRITAEQVMGLDAARIQYARYVQLDVDKTCNISALKATLAQYRREDGLQCLLHYTRSEASCDVLLADTWSLVPNEALQAALEDVPGVAKASVVYPM